MKILYIGEAEETGAKLVNTLSRTDAVIAAFPQKPIYEVDCIKTILDNDIESAICDNDIDTVVILEDRSATVKDTERILSCAADHHCRIFYIREQSFFRRRDNKADVACRLCEGLSQECGVDTILVSVSCLYSQERSPRFVEEAIYQIERRRELTPGGFADEICDSLHIDDFCTAMDSIIHRESKEPFERIELQSAYPFTLSSFVEDIKKRYGELSVQPYTEKNEEREYTPYQSDAWMPEHSFTDDMPVLLDHMEEKRRDLQKSKRKKGFNIALKIGAFAIIFVLIEMITQFISVASDLQFVDLRLLFVAAASLFFGKHYGIAAATMCGIASIIQSLLAGNRWYVLFYHVDNWIPLAVYFIVAIVLGIYQDKKVNHDRTGMKHI